MARSVGCKAFTLGFLGAIAGLSAQADPLMIVGLDQKIAIGDDGKPVLSLPGKDSVVHR